jgi:hypothetical protein
MFKTWATVLLVAGAVVATGQTPKKHRDYVPDSKTAERIAEAVLVAQYGEGRVNTQLPLHADGSNGDYWIVQGHGEGRVISKGGGPAVWINKYSGCIKLLEHMK